MIGGAVTVTSGRSRDCAYELPEGAAQQMLAATRALASAAAARMAPPQRVQILTAPARPLRACSPRSCKWLTSPEAILEPPELPTSTNASPTTSGVSRLRVSLCSLLAVLTVSPITVNEKLCSLPTSPSTAGP